MNEPYAHQRCATCDRPDIKYNITRCYGKHVAVFAVAVATGDIIKYQSFVYGSFVWKIQVRYNNFKYIVFQRPQKALLWSKGLKGATLIGMNMLPKRYKSSPYENR